MEGEIQNFIKVWVTICVSLCYCYGIRNIIPKGLKRLIFVLPIVCLFLYLPLILFSPHLGGTTAFFISWLANFKLLLLAFGKGPLCSDPDVSLPLFLAVSCLPIKIQNKHVNGHNSQNPSPKSPQNGKNKQNPLARKIKDGPLNYAIKGLLVGILVKIYDYSDYIHPFIISFLYAFHMYFVLDINLAITAALARTILGIELEPQFNEPFLSTSLQDFWGRRWNLMVSSILRPTVYEPTRNILTRAFGRYWATLLAVFGTFVVSAIMHELMFYYLVRVSPTWEISAFFLLNGFCVTMEIHVKKSLKGRWQLPGIVSGILAIGFVMTTAFWLFFPKFVKGQIDVRAFQEYAAIGAFVKDASQRVVSLLPGHQRYELHD